MGGNLAKVGDQNVLSRSFLLLLQFFCVLVVLSEEEKSEQLLSMISHLLHADTKKLLFRLFLFLNQ